MFIGRQTEIKILNRLLTFNTACLVVLKGRRRIGKSRLVAEFAKSHLFYRFTGLSPENAITEQDQLNHFAKQFAEQFNTPEFVLTDWGKAFKQLAQQTRKGRVIILLDEITWMAMSSKTFLGLLKIAWDDELKLNSKLILFVCGSVSSWIEKNILSSTGFLGRPTMHMTIDELPLQDCKEFWQPYTDKISNYEKLKLLSFTGGVPRYLELINPKL